MPKVGFVGPSNTTENSVANDQFTMNFYPEQDAFNGVSALVLNPTPGLAAFCTPPGGAKTTRGSIPYNGRAFYVVDGSFREVFIDGTTHDWGTITNDGNPCSFAAANAQILICSALGLWVFDTGANTLTAIPALTAGVAKVDFISGFFLALLTGSNAFQYSSIDDATMWDPADKVAVSVFGGNVPGMIVDHNEIWLFGDLASTVFYLTGDALNPFAVNTAAGVIEQGIGAALSVVKLDNTIFWLGNDARGTLVAWRAAGYTPQRVSTHAIELILQQLARAHKITDCVAYSYQDQGHSFWMLRFPSADLTLCYDVATGLWHNRGYWNSANGVFHAHHSWNHMNAFGRHLVGDWSSPNLYDMSTTLVDDAGDKIRRVRRSPPISNENLRVYCSRLEIMLEEGLGPQPPLTDGAGLPRPPMANLRQSMNGGKTWGDTRTAGAGFAGEYNNRVIFNRLGQGRVMVFEISMTDSIPWRLIDAYAMLEAGGN